MESNAATDLLGPVFSCRAEASCTEEKVTVTRIRLGEMFGNSAFATTRN